MVIRRCAIGLCLVMASGLEEECFSSDCSPDSNFLQMQLSLDSQLESEETGIIDTIKSKIHPLTDIVQKIKEAREAKEAKEAKASSKSAHDAQNTKQNSSEEEELVVDRSNFSHLLSDLYASEKEMGHAQGFTKKFEEALLRVESAKQQVESAQESKESVLERIHKLLGVSIEYETLLNDSLPLDEAVRRTNPLVEPANIALKTATEVAERIEELRKLDQKIVKYEREYEKALQEQTGNVTKIQSLLRAAIMREMSDTRLVQVLDASDRLAGTVTVTTTTTVQSQPSTVIVVVPEENLTTAKPSKAPKRNVTKAKEAPARTTSPPPIVNVSNATSNSTVGDALGLYPSDWAVIGSLILLGVLVALITIYSRTVVS